jgi:D-alanine-D-alanine ligase
MNLQTAEFGKVAVLMGGKSAEREISLMSGQGVLQALLSKGVNAHAFDPGLRPLNHLAPEGFQGALELLGIPYTGSGVMASAIAMDKVMTKRLWSAVELPTPRYILLDAQIASSQPADGVVDSLGLPVIVKPPREGSSLGVSKVKAGSELSAAISMAAKYDTDVLCEEFIDGEEITCPILGRGDLARTLPIIRINAPEGAYDYENKYFTEVVQYQCPSGLPAGEEAEISRVVLQAYKSLGCRGWARADLMIRAHDRRAFLLEMNTSPGMTSHSLVPMAARAAGISYEDLCVQVLALAALDNPGGALL